MKMTLEAALRDLEDRDARVRAQAADALGRAPDAERARAVGALVRAERDESPAVRYAALLSLGELGAAETVDLAAGALDDVEPLVREAAAIALGDLGQAAEASSINREAAWGALAKALGSNQPEVRFQAIASLTEIAAERAAPLVRPLLDDEDVKVRAQAAAALGDARDRSAADALAARLEDAPEVRLEAALALAQLGDRRGAHELIAALDGPSALDAAGALAELGVADDADARAALEKKLGGWFGDPLVKVRAAEALARAGDARALEHLRRATRARREDVRGLAESVLSQLSDVRR